MNPAGFEIYNPGICYCFSRDIQFNTTVKGGGGPVLMDTCRNRNRSPAAATPYVPGTNVGSRKRRCGVELWKVDPVRMSTAMKAELRVK